ncbi:MAG: isoaspartyl peptidase/L-asparaginase, partial [Pseudomonadota bacterium]
EHVMFAGAAADAFAEAHGLEPVENSYFTTEFRAQALEEALQQDGEARDKRGTVGAVALDLEGHLAAATSTGGMTAKAPGRVGDSPIIGAGTYADDSACAVSGTGHGEYFIRTAVARTICARMALQGLDGGAAATILLDEVQALGGDGGVIVIDPKGDVSMVFNTEGMFRGVASSDGVIETAIYGVDD